jgi:hypothetical protein
MAAKPLRATPYAALQPSHSIKKSGQSICFKTGQFYLLLTVRQPAADDAVHAGAAA